MLSRRSIAVPSTLLSLCLCLIARAGDDPAIGGKPLSELIRQVQNENRAENAKEPAQSTARARGALVIRRMEGVGLRGWGSHGQGSWKEGGGRSQDVSGPAWTRERPDGFASLRPAPGRAGRPR